MKVDERERPMEDASEAPGQHDGLGLPVIVDHPALESLDCGLVLLAARRLSAERAGRRANHRPPTIMHGDIQASNRCRTWSGSFHNRGRRE